MIELIDSLLLGAIRAGTPLMLIGIGVLINEKSGMLNLGQEGMIMTGAITAFACSIGLGQTWLSLAVAATAGAMMGFLFASIVLVFRTNQVATGLALTLFGTGLAAYIGASFTGESIEGVTNTPLPLLSQIPLVGKALFSQDYLVYFSLTLFLCTWFILYKTRSGLILEAVGHSPMAAHRLGYPVNSVRLISTMIGGAFAGCAGAYLSLAYTPIWSENMSAGRGWIGLALVVLAGWKVPWVVFGAYLFGFVTIIPLGAQAVGYGLPSDLMAMSPYIATILALLVIGSSSDHLRSLPPTSLGKNFERGES